MGLKEQMRVANEQMKGFEIPSLPAELIALQTLLESTDYPDLTEVASIIERNTVLSGELIKVSNNIGFKMEESAEVCSVKEAIESLGLHRLKKLIFGLGFKTQVAEHVFDELINHSVEVANICVELSASVENLDAEDAYMAGLFHNAGAIIMAMRFPDYEPIFYNTISNCYSGLSKEIKVYQTHHGVFGLLVAREWKLQSRYAQVMLMHHQKNISVVKDDRIRALVAVVQLATTIVSEALFNSYLGEEVAMMKENAIAELMLDSADIDEIRLSLMTNSLN